MTPEDAKASLGIATRLQEMMLSQGQDQGEMPQEQTQQEQPQEAQSQETPQEPPQEPNQPDEMSAKFSELELNLTNKLDEIRKELKSDTSKEIDGIKKDIADALK